MTGGDGRPSGRPATWWTILCLLARLHLIGLGALVMSVGQSDDSPGLGGLGLVNAAIGLVALVRAVQGRRR